MFALFYCLYLAMIKGNWRLYSLNEIPQHIKEAFNALGKFLTSIFNDGQVYSTFGTDFFNGTDNAFYNVIALVLATITTIGIVVMAVKGIKRVFGVFFMGIR